VRRLLPLGVIVLVLALAACGGGKEARPLPVTVEGTVAQQEIAGDAARGKAVFAESGCGGCHTYALAKSTGKVGPDLDKLGDDADKANQPLAEYVHTSIVNPDAYVVPGYQKGVMPPYGGMPKEDLAGLVEFLTNAETTDDATSG
jgi:cytochrome c551/c552